MDIRSGSSLVKTFGQSQDDTRSIKTRCLLMYDGLKIVLKYTSTHD